MLGAVAFVEPDGLAIRTVPDGPFIRLATGGRIHSPRFSPSGQWIAFHDGDHLYVAGAGGRPPLPLPAGECVWLPAEDVLAVATDGALLFFAARNGWALPSLIRKGAGLPVFNSEATEFVYAGAVRKGAGPAAEPLREGQLWRGFYTGAAREPALVTSKYPTNLIPFAWTRDSQSILYWEDPDFSASLMADGLELLTVAASGGEPRRTGVSTLVHRDLLALSPLRNRLALTAGSGRETWEAKRIAILDLDTMALRYLTEESTSALAPAWSPDGRRVAFSQAPTAALPNLGLRKIWMADAAGVSPPRQITRDERYRDELPQWSARGTHLLFCRLDSGGSGTLWLMGAGGENPTQVSGPLRLEDGPTGYYGYVDWRRAFDWYRGPQA
jgi:TolB protein